MSVRSVHIPVCRLTQLVPKDQSWTFRRAQRGDYGAITHDAKGRQQVEIARVELAERVHFTDGQIARALATPSVNKALTKTRRISPALHTIELPERLYSRAEVRALIEQHVIKRDASWHRFNGRVDQLTADILDTASN